MDKSEISTLNVVAEILEQSVKKARQSSKSEEMHMLMLVNDVRFAIGMVNTLLQKYDADGNKKQLEPQ